MGRRRGLVAARLALLAVVLLAALAPASPALAEPVGTHLGVANVAPDFASATLRHDAAPAGQIHYDVAAVDRNGAADLDRLVITVHGASGHAQRHVDDLAVQQDKTHAVWRGVILLDASFTEGPYSFRLDIYDRHDASARLEGATRPTVPEPSIAAAAPAFAPLAAGLQVLDDSALAPMIAFTAGLLTGALAMLALIGACTPRAESRHAARRLG